MSTPQPFVRSADIHYRDPESGNERSNCAAEERAKPGEEITCTTDRSRVTCKDCLKGMGAQWKPGDRLYRYGEKIFGGTRLTVFIIVSAGPKELRIEEEETGALRQRVSRLAALSEYAPTSELAREKFAVKCEAEIGKLKTRIGYLESLAASARKDQDQT